MYTHACNLAPTFVDKISLCVISILCISILVLYTGNELMYNISVKLNRTVTGVPTQDDFIDLIHNSSNFYSDCSFGKSLAHDIIFYE